MSDQRQAAKAAELNIPPNERLAADTWAVVHGKAGSVSRVKVVYIT